MLGVIASHEGMLVAMWIVLIALGLEMVIYLATHLRHKSDIDDMSKVVTRPVLFDLVPLIILSLLTALDGTHILMLIWYYAAAVLIVLRVLLRLGVHVK